jgi:peptidoglycan/xylan/chitin deacetylase (PgdA/CDA1 family)
MIVGRTPWSARVPLDPLFGVQHRPAGGPAADQGVRPTIMPTDAMKAIFPAAICTTAAAMAWAVRGRASSVFGPSIYHGPRDRSAIALTFDDGPSEDTPRLLEVLDRYNASATFFQCGANVERLPAIARAVQAAGHEIGNHSYAHPLYCCLTPAQIQADLARAQQVIAAATTAQPALFRAPYGVRWFGLRQAQRQLGLLGVMWTAIGYDWKAPVHQVVSRLAGAGNGAILCLHDGRELGVKPDIAVTVEAVRALVPMLRDRGYRLETVSQLICPKN